MDRENLIIITLFVMYSRPRLWARVMVVETTIERLFLISTSVLSVHDLQEMCLIGTLRGF